jgi:hypothetical protein
MGIAGGEVIQTWNFVGVTKIIASSARQVPAWTGWQAPQRMGGFQLALSLTKSAISAGKECTMFQHRDESSRAAA